MKYYSNIQVIKLKEYSRSYGGRETVTYAYGVDNGKTLTVYNESGVFIRSLRIGTKLLVSYSGEAMTAEAFNYVMADLSKQRGQERKAVELKLDQERAKAIELYKSTVDFIKKRVTADKAMEWVERFKEGNSQQRNRKWANKAVQIGLDYSDSRILRDVCKEIAI